MKTYFGDSCIVANAATRDSLKLHEAKTGPI